MDALSEVLEGVRFRGRLYCKVSASAPWGLSAEPTDVATFHGVLRGRAVLRLTPNARPIELAEGDLVVLSHGSGHSIADAIDTPTQPIAGVLAVADKPRLITPGGKGRKTELVCGCFFSDVRNLPPLFSFLPPMLHVPAQSGSGGLLALLGAEAGRERGADAAIARLTEALFVHAMRTWIESDEPASATWLAAMRDPAIGTALGAMHRKPEQDWTVKTLARVAGISRSGFAARFVATLGETPVHYLTRWRIYLATRQLRETKRAISEIASTVGYESEAALNKAFKRLIGVPPGAYRRAIV
jgi:AraC-like DNA-binding protein